MTGGERMKKLVAVTTTILIILIAVLSVFMIKGHGSDSSTAKSTLSDLKESLSDKEDTKAACLYVTLEPCSMCAGALINSRIKKVYIGASDEKTGAVGSVFNLLDDYTFNHKVEYEKGILQEDCENLLKQFFKELRKMKK